jgi:hypothetical protein
MDEYSYIPRTYGIYGHIGLDSLTSLLLSDHSTPVLPDFFQDLALFAPTLTLERKSL